MGRILVGTASWADPGLIRCSKFYPSTIKSAEARLRFYAHQFPIVEIDSTFYALPSYRNAELWSERTPNDFVFNVKAFRLFTEHPTELRVLPRQIQALIGGAGGKKLYYRDAPAEIKNELWRQFVLSLEPLARAGKLGAILFQFPRWFVKRKSSIDRLREIRERLGDRLIAVEFRHGSWFAEARSRSTLDFEREMEFSHVIADEPQGLPGSIPAVWEVTLPKLAMVRLHGRNRETWNKSGLSSAAERFNYEYTNDELLEFIPRIRAIASAADTTHVICNVNFEDQGIRLAQRLRGSLIEVLTD